MATDDQQLVALALAIHQELGKLAKNNASTSEQAKLLEKFRDACERLILANFDLASENDIENRLWNVHLRINTLYRKSLSHFRKNGNDSVVEHRKVGKQYLTFIKASQRFYRRLILKLDSQFAGIPELRKVAEKWQDDSTDLPSHHQVSPELRHRVLLSCFHSLVRLGDLSRYRETELVDKNKDRNWGPAKGYYGLAADIYPVSGMPHNQQAVIAREDGNHFRATYHLYRSLASKEPHPSAKDNLELEFKKILSAWQSGQLINNQSSDGNTTGRALIAWFVRLHSKCYKGQEFAQHDELENEVLTQLAVELKERSLDSILQKIIIINLAAEYFARFQLQELTSHNNTENIFRSYCFFLRLNIKTFFRLLQILQPELETLSDGDDVKKQTAPQNDKVTAVARRVLPALRLYSIWFSRNWHFLNATNLADTLTTVDVQELWKAYAETLTLLTMTFPPQELPLDDYLLEEDVETIGFQPLFGDDTRRFWYNGEQLKKKWSDPGRSHPNIEMRMRIRALLIDGALLAKEGDAPLDLDGLRFFYREAGLPSELLASPNNQKAASPLVPPETMEMPLFPTETPLAEDQVSHSVAPSESASTVLAKDPAMNRMVDDLVGADDGLDPLLEEDENYPPTPPEQTFEDTTMVTESSYGIGPLTIKDIVNSNFGRSIASPQTPVLSTSMERVPSAIRQPAHLPSLPDGRSNGRSIWNKDYTSTPGPSSPVIGGSMAHGTPTSLYNSTGHLRIESSYSARESEWTPPSATPVQQSVGMGSAPWGNAGVSHYASIYGGYPARGTSDLNMLSPIPFGKSRWSPGPENGRSSFSRTPSRGQGG